LNNQQATNWTRIALKAAITLAIAGYPISALTQTQDAGAKTRPEIYQTLYLTNVTPPHDAEDLEQVLRNNLSKARLMYVPSQNAISILASAEDIALAQKILSDLDKTRKIYRLTYTLKESDGGKTIGLQHFSIIVGSGSMTVFKQGSRIPVLAQSSNQGENPLTYLDVGLEVEASVDGYLDGVRLRTKLVQSGIAEEKSVVGTQDPIIRQTTLEGTSTLAQGKPLVLGSLDVPGSTRHQEVEVVSELVR
jgi:hypothetical protein